MRLWWLKYALDDSLLFKDILFSREWNSKYAHSPTASRPSSDRKRPPAAPIFARLTPLEIYLKFLEVVLLELPASSSPSSSVGGHNLVLPPSVPKVPLALASSSSAASSEGGVVPPRLRGLGGGGAGGPSSVAAPAELRSQKFDVVMSLLATVTHVLVLRLGLLSLNSFASVTPGRTLELLWMRLRRSSVSEETALPPQQQQDVLSSAADVYWSMMCFAYGIRVLCTCVGRKDRLAELGIELPRGTVSLRERGQAFLDCIRRCGGEEHEQKEDEEEERSDPLWWLSRKLRRLEIQGSSVAEEGDVLEFTPFASSVVETEVRAAMGLFWLFVGDFRRGENVLRPRRHDDDDEESASAAGHLLDEEIEEEEEEGGEGREGSATAVLLARQHGLERLKKRKRHIERIGESVGILCEKQTSRDQSDGLDDVVLSPEELVRECVGSPFEEEREGEGEVLSQSSRFVSGTPVEIVRRHFANVLSETEVEVLEMLRESAEFCRRGRRSSRRTITPASSFRKKTKKNDEEDCDAMRRFLSRRLSPFLSARENRAVLFLRYLWTYCRGVYNAIVAVSVNGPDLPHVTVFEQCFRVCGFVGLGATLAVLGCTSGDGRVLLTRQQWRAIVMKHRIHSFSADFEAQIDRRCQYCCDEAKELLRSLLQEKKMASSSTPPLPHLVGHKRGRPRSSSVESRAAAERKHRMLSEIGIGALRFDSGSTTSSVLSVPPPSKRRRVAAEKHLAVTYLLARSRKLRDRFESEDGLASLQSAVKILHDQNEDLSLLSASTVIDERMLRFDGYFFNLASIFRSRRSRARKPTTGTGDVAIVSETDAAACRVILEGMKALIVNSPHDALIPDLLHLSSLLQLLVGMGERTFIQEYFGAIEKHPSVVRTKSEVLLLCRFASAVVSACDAIYRLRSMDSVVVEDPRIIPRMSVKDSSLSLVTLVDMFLDREQERPRLMVRWQFVRILTRCENPVLMHQILSAVCFSIAMLRRAVVEQSSSLHSQAAANPALAHRQRTQSLPPMKQFYRNYMCAVENFLSPKLLEVVRTTADHSEFLYPAWKGGLPMELRIDGALSCLLAESLSPIRPLLTPHPMCGVFYYVAADLHYEGGRFRDALSHYVRGLSFFTKGFTKNLLSSASSSFLKDQTAVRRVAHCLTTIGEVTAGAVMLQVASPTLDRAFVDQLKSFEIRWVPFFWELDYLEILLNIANWSEDEVKKRAVQTQLERNGINVHANVKWRKSFIAHLMEGFLKLLFAGYS